MGTLNTCTNAQSYAIAPPTPNEMSVTGNPSPGASDLHLTASTHTAFSGRPTVDIEDVVVNLPRQRDQIKTRNDPEFARLRTHVYEFVQQAKRGWRPASEQE